MAIVNQLSYSQRRRDLMVNGRNGMTYAANITVLSLSLILFIFIINSSLAFTILTLICLGIGLVTTIIYSVMIKEKSLTKLALEYEENYKASLGPTVNTIKELRVNHTEDGESLLGESVIQAPTP